MAVPGGAVDGSGAEEAHHPLSVAAGGLGAVEALGALATGDGPGEGDAAAVFAARDAHELARR